MSERSLRRPLALTLATAAIAAAALGSGTAAVAAPGQPGAPRYTEGADGVGDPYFPLTGNGGIDVVHYDLVLDYTPPASEALLEGDLAGVATIDLIATQDLNRFNLDLRGLTASKVVVNGKSMAFDQDENSLLLLWEGGREELATCGKLELARKLIARIADRRAAAALPANVVRVRR